jgi:Acyl carrier protein
MEAKVIEILKSVCETENVNAESNQSNTDNWDSLHQLNLVVELEDTFDVTLEPEEIAEMKSVADILAILRKK